MYIHIYVYAHCNYLQQNVAHYVSAAMLPDARQRGNWPNELHISVAITFISLWIYFDLRNMKAEPEFFKIQIADNIINIIDKSIANSQLVCRFDFMCIICAYNIIFILL